MATSPSREHSSNAARANVLLTCCGHKGYLVPILRRSPRLGRLSAVDLDPAAPIAHRVDRFRAAPPVEEAAYVETLLELCREERVDAVLAQNDLDLVVLAEAAPRLAELGTLVAGAGPEVTRAAGDKLLMGDWLEGHGLLSPRTVPAAQARELSGPVVVKQRCGQGSQGLRVCRDAGELAELLENGSPEADSRVAQEFVAGEEYNLDVLRRHDGAVVAVVPKRKLAMRWGSTDRAVATADPRLLELGRRLAAATAHVGSIDVDVMAAADGTLLVIDVNPRLGGGFPFTAHWCPRYVDALLAICRGEAPEPFVGEHAVGRPMYRDFCFLDWEPDGSSEVDCGAAADGQTT